MEVLNLKNPWIIGITGASGICYARKLIELLINNFPEIKLEVIFSEAAIRVLREEEDLTISLNQNPIAQLLGFDKNHKFPNISVHNNRDIGASIASGSYLTSGMIVVPCSMKTLAAISNGYADNLIQRAADVILKEKRRLLIIPRETPLSQIHLENMIKLAKMDTRIIPAMPGFYQKPKTIEDFVEHFCLKILDQMGLELAHQARWKSSDQEKHIAGLEVWKR